MKLILLAALAALALLAAADETEVEDLGSVTPKQGLYLERETARSDWSHFDIEFIALPSSNKLTLFNYTDTRITVTNLAALPSGRVLMALHNVTRDGRSSAARLYRFELWRGEVPRPSARIITFGGHPEPQRRSLLDRHPTPASTPLPPLPGPVLNDVREARAWSPIPPEGQWPPNPPPLPGGTNQTYADHLDAAAERQIQFYSKPGRRNE